MFINKADEMFILLVTVSIVKKIFLIDTTQEKKETLVSSLRQKAENGGFLSKGQEQTLDPSFMDSVETSKEARRKQIEAEIKAANKAASGNTETTMIPKNDHHKFQKSHNLKRR